MPVLMSGMPEKNASKAARPPAEAPIPTMGMMGEALSLSSGWSSITEDGLGAVAVRSRDTAFFSRLVICVTS